MNLRITASKRTQFRWFSLAAACMAMLICGGTTSIFGQEPKPESKAPATSKDAKAPAESTDAKAPVASPSRPLPRGVKPQSQRINELLAKAWDENKIKPSARAGNLEFMRRVYLDLIGRIATPAEVRFFEANPDRARLVQRLLYEKVKIEGTEYDYPGEFARNWANIWTVLLMTRTGNPVYHDQMRVWLEELFEKNGSHKEMVEKLLTATGKTNSSNPGEANPAVNYILKHLGETTPNGKEDEEGYFDMVPVTSRTTRLFLGLQTNCVQCHDHPFNPEWKQHNFWGVNVFFRQLKREPLTLGRMRNMNEAPILTLLDNPNLNKEGMIAYEKRSGVVLFTKAVFLDGRKPDFEGRESFSRRQHLADLITSSPNFAKAYVNRIWGHLFGRGLCEQPSVDDFGDHNKVVHPELLDYLAKEFATESTDYDLYKYNAFDPKKLLYWICTSEPYNLSSVANASNDKPEHDVFFGRMLLKSMSPEQLFESLAIATEGPPRSGGYSEERKKKREAWMKNLVLNFGDDEGNEITFNGTLIQALMMMNGKDITAAIKNKDRGTVFEAMRKGRTPNKVIDELFLAALNRHPTSAELNRIMTAGNKFRDSVSINFYTDVFWALLNSNQFMLNH